MMMIAGHTPRTRPSASPSSSWQVRGTVVASLPPPPAAARQLVLHDGSTHRNLNPGTDHP